MRTHFFPIRPTCSYWPYKEARCPRKAEFMLVHPDGGVVPGGYECRQHGEAAVKEYAEKLGETWTLEPIVTEQK